MSRRTVRASDLRGLAAAAATRATPAASTRTTAGISRAHRQADALIAAVVRLGGPPGVPEHRFHATRRWRWDIAWPDLRFAIEIDGGGWIAGRHSRGKGMAADREKDAAALLDGWRVLHVMPEHVASGQAAEWAIRMIERATRDRGGTP